MEAVRSVRTENHFGTHLPAPPILGINHAKLFLKSRRNVACPSSAPIVPSLYVDRQCRPVGCIRARCIPTAGPPDSAVRAAHSRSRALSQSPASNPLAFSANQLAVDTAPVAILLWRPPLSPSQQSLARSQETLQLVIDEAGKVHSAKLLFPSHDPELMNATKNWKFIPAFKDGQPVAYKLKLGVLPYQ